MHVTHKYWIGGLLMVAGGLLAAPAARAETDADFSRYCRETFPNSGPVMRAPGGVPAHYCNQGGTLQGIDLARACELTTGSRDYRMLGTRVLCADGPGPQQAASDPLTASDFVTFCRGRFANAIYDPVPTAQGLTHHCRIVGAGGATRQPIDLAEACDTLRGTASYRIEANRVFCEGGGDAGTAERRAAAAGQGGSSSGDREADRPQDPGDREEPAADPAPKDSGDSGAKGSDQARARPAPATEHRPTGVWTMTAGVLEDMKVRFDWSGDEMTAIITELPEEAAAIAHESYDLEVGDAVAVGRMQESSLQLRTRLGVVGARSWVAANCAGNLGFFDQMRESRWTLPGWYPVYQLTFKAGRISGRHGGLEFVVPRNRPAGFNMCVNNNAPFTPDAQIGAQMSRVVRKKVKVDPEHLLPNYAISFTLEQDVCASPDDAPPLTLMDLFNERLAATSRQGRRP